MAKSASASPPTSVSMWPASARSARLPVKSAPSTSTTRNAAVSPSVVRSRGRERAAAVGRCACAMTRIVAGFLLQSVIHHDRSLVLHGQRFHFLDWGAPTAPAVVLLHGITGHARAWDDEARAPAARYRVLALDARGQRRARVEVRSRDPRRRPLGTVARSRGPLAALERDHLPDAHRARRRVRRARTGDRQADARDESARASRRRARGGPHGAGRTARRVPAAAHRVPRRLTASLRLLWFGAFAFFLSFFLLLAGLPPYARAVGVGDRALGGVLGAFAFAAMLVRPWAGWAADRHGRRPLMLAGALVFAVASLAYSLAAGALGLLAVRLLHGCGMGLYPTAASAVVADLAPPARRGAVMGTFGAAANIAMALAPIAGLAVADRLGFVPLFQLAACVAVVALLLTQRLPEPARSRATIPFTPGALVSVDALVPSAVLFLVMLGYGALVTFLPIHARQQDVNPGLFFLVFALVVPAVRNYAGPLSDRFGRVIVAAAGLGLAGAALDALAVRSDASLM